MGEAERTTEQTLCKVTLTRFDGSSLTLDGFNAASMECLLIDSADRWGQWVCADHIRRILGLPTRGE